MSQRNLTINDRNKIEVLHKEGYSARSIAKIIERHHSTISRELSRCPSAYIASVAEEDKHIKSSNKGRKSKASSEYIQTIKDKLELKWSPEQIVGSLFKQKLCFKTIYNWIYSNTIDFDISGLRRKGKSRQAKEKRGRFNVGKSISKRPKDISERKTFGHWELDTVVSSRGKSKGCLATFVERKTRFYIAIPMKDRSKDSMYRAIMSVIGTLPLGAIKSFTSDRGKEFACYEDIERKGIEFYFADPYSAWQRGSNENSNGLLREYYPKRTDLSKITLNGLIKNLKELNNRPRKCLNYQAPIDLFMYELSLL